MKKPGSDRHQFAPRLGAPNQHLRKPAIPKTDAIGKSGTDVFPSFDTTNDTMTAEKLLGRAKRSIESCETSLRAAAEDIASAYDRGATQREVAEGVGRSAAWVNRLLQWRKSGYEGTAFGNKPVQGVNKRGLSVEPVSAHPALASAACAPLTGSGSPDSARPEPVVEAIETVGSIEAQDRVDTTPALLPATNILSAPHASVDCHLPAACNRQDPERAFKRLAEQWSSNPFRDLLLDAPKAAQDRFLREVLMSELSGPEAVSLSPSGEGGEQ